MLAKLGLKVTHFDISQPMIDKAEELAEKAGVIDNITFVKGALEDLPAYKEKSFDLVMSFDAPISYTYPKQREEFLEFCYKYDSNSYVCGMGKDNLLAYGELD